MTSGVRPLPRLHVITDDAVVARKDFIERSDGLLRTGGERVALHLRAPRAPGGDLFRLAARLAAVAEASGSRLLVNDRLDVALAAGAAGVQLGARGLRPEDARRVMGAGVLVGVSVHGLVEAEAAAAAGADFLLAGTLYPTPSHPERAPTGAGWLGGLAALGPRVIGIGGIGRARLPELVAAGAWGVAVMRAIWDAERPCQEVLRFIDGLYTEDPEH